jgi:hypothetical protein
VDVPVYLMRETANGREPRLYTPARWTATGFFVEPPERFSAEPQAVCVTWTTAATYGALTLTLSESNEALSALGVSGLAYTASQIQGGHLTFGVVDDGGAHCNQPLWGDAVAAFADLSGDCPHAEILTTPTGHRALVWQADQGPDDWLRGFCVRTVMLADDSYVRRF